MSVAEVMKEVRELMAEQLQLLEAWTYGPGTGVKAEVFAYEMLKGAGLTAVVWQEKFLYKDAARNRATLDLLLAGCTPQNAICFTRRVLAEALTVGQL